MRCSNCSAPLPEGSKFCNACGAALSPECRKMSGPELRKATQKELMFIRERVYGVAYEVGRLYK
ncbi:MAG: zinc ribbon domain-containing protein [Lachnospiraceae bacterium]|nr:zinc ribbon domain-containing protein [Lachnospiraceae bacterium]